MITRALKITIQKQKDLTRVLEKKEQTSTIPKKGFFGKKSNLDMLNTKITKIVESTKFQNFKVVIETGIAVSGVIALISAFGETPVNLSDIEALENKLNTELTIVQDLLKTMLERDGFKINEEGKGINTAVFDIEPKEKDISEIEAELEQKTKENEELKKQKNLANRISIASVITVGIMALLMTIKPTKALELITQLYDNDDFGKN